MTATLPATQPAQLLDGPGCSVSHNHSPGLPQNLPKGHKHICNSNSSAAAALQQRTTSLAGFRQHALLAGCVREFKLATAWVACRVSAQLVLSSSSCVIASLLTAEAQIWLVVRHRHYPSATTARDTPWTATERRAHSLWGTPCRSA
jgi:hypothetical protein